MTSPGPTDAAPGRAGPRQGGGHPTGTETMMMRAIRRIAAAAAVLGLALATAGPAHATIMLNIQDGTYTTGTPTGNSTNPNGQTFNGTTGSPPGVVGVLGATSGVFTIDATGRAFVNPSSLDLSSITTSSTGSGTLFLTLTDRNFTNATASTFATAFSQLTTNFFSGSSNVTSIELKTYANSDNRYFSMAGPLMTDIVTTGSGIVSQTRSVPNLSSPYSLTLQLIVTTTGAFRLSSDGNVTITSTPEPGTLAAAAAGVPLALLGLRNPRRRRQLA